MYRLTHNASIIRESDNASIPADIGNRDYRKYLAWVADGNQPTPATPLPNPRIAEIKQRLAAIDIESVRPLRAKSTGKDQQADRAKLESLETESAALRLELAGL